MNALTLLASRVTGDGSPPVVLLHGLAEDARSWDTVAPALAARRRVYALDLRGHGDSARTGEYSFELMRDDVIAFLEATGDGPYVLAGHSMGGIVAVLLAQKAPHLVSRLVLEDAIAPRPGTLRRPPKQRPARPTPYDFAVVNAIRAQVENPDPAWFDDLAVVRAPTLVIGGAHSHIHQDALAAAVRRMPDARLVTLDTGHHVHRDRPAEFVAAVEDFLA